ncbi:MAG: acetate kinase [Candidatus Omnitrophica bacterium]|nr:acetate kinase [Candidatus Omnitrophota bacterium]
MNIVVINSGSSSVKYQLFDMKRETVLGRGIVERIGLQKSRLQFFPLHKKKITIQQDVHDHATAIRMALDTLIHKEHGVLKKKGDIDAVGHRVVHGAEAFSSSVLIDGAVIRAIKKYSQLAPLHNPPNLRGIVACQKILRGVPQVAVFDTSFYHSIPRPAYLYGLPLSLYEKEGIRRYGFHGTSHRYVTLRAARLMKAPPRKLRLISCHLGNGCSVTATKYGKAIETSMGFTPLEGVMMGTRCGSVDPAIVIYLIENCGMSPEKVHEMLNKKSGLLGVSGVSSDMRDVYNALSRGNSRARIAFEMFVYQIQKCIGAYAVILDGLDGLIFTGGIGENHGPTRTAICKHLACIGMTLDEKKNTHACGEAVISRTHSPVKILTIPTNEELMIAKDTYKIVRMTDKR